VLPVVERFLGPNASIAAPQNGVVPVWQRVERALIIIPWH
jgi:hypothetical protein